MRVPDFLKRFVSRFVDRKIEKGYGFTTDNSISLPPGTDLDSLSKDDEDKGVYRLRQIPGPFVFVGHVGGSTAHATKPPKVLYQLKHKYTGETFNVTREMLNFFFEKYDL